MKLKLEIKDIAKNCDVNIIYELETKLNDSSKESNELKEQLKGLKEENKSLSSENYKLQHDLLKIKEENESKLKNLTSKLLHEKDLTKSLLVVRSDLLNRNFFNRILNKEPDSSKKIGKIKELPYVETFSKE